MVHYKIKRLRTLRNNLGLSIILVVMTVMVIFSASCTQKPLGKNFASPDEAVTALIDALKQNNNQQLISIFGPEGKNLFIQAMRLQIRRTGHALSGNLKKSTAWIKKIPQPVSFMWERRIGLSPSQS